MVKIRPLDSRSRVTRALHGDPIDRPAIGEVSVDDDLVRDALGLEAGAAVPLAARYALLQRWQHDLITIQVPGDKGDLETALFALRYWRQESPLFVFSQIPGLLNDLTRVRGRTNLTRMAALDVEQVAQIVADAVLERCALVEKSAAAGAEGLIICDDLATSGHLVLPLPLLQQVYFPYLTILVTQAQTTGLPVVLSSAGKVALALPELVESGLNGLHGLQPAAGLSPAGLIEASGGTLCPWGSFDAAWLGVLDQPSPGEPEAALTRLVRGWGRDLSEAPAIFGFWNGVSAHLTPRQLEQLYTTVIREGQNERRARP